MRVVIIEDETAAAQNLSAVLRKLMPEVDIVATIDTVVDSVEFFGSAPQLDLVFMDIHLADGSSFRIFDSATIEAPIIFTTAYDQYALEAFKVNSIDYLLKPINEQEVQRAIDKWQRLTAVDRAEYASRVDSMAHEQQPEKLTFLVRFRDKIVPLPSDSIAFCYTTNERVTAHCFTGERYPLDHTLEALQGMLPSQHFFRANRQYIISRAAVKDISVWFGSRLSVDLKVEMPEKLVVSKARVQEFKRWLTSAID